MPGGLKPLGRERRDAAPVEAMESVANCHEFKLARDLEVLGSAGPPFDVSGTSLGGEGLGIADRFFLLVDREDVGEMLG